MLVVVFFFKQETAYEMSISVWSSDVCSSDLSPGWAAVPGPGLGLVGPSGRVGGGDAVGEGGAADDAGSVVAELRRGRARGRRRGGLWRGGGQGTGPAPRRGGGEIRRGQRYRRGAPTCGGSGGEWEGNGGREGGRGV